MQRVLTFTHGKKKYVSKPWNFEAFCRVSERHVQQDYDGDGTPIGNKTNSVARIGSDTVDYLFEGTDATQDILDSCIAEKYRMCRQVFEWYLEDATRKNVQTPATEETEEK